MRYLVCKYNRPYEDVASILSKGTKLAFPGDSMHVSKQNMLNMMEIWRDLKKCKMVAKIDSYYISTVALRIFTTSEMARYMREQSDMERLFEEESPKAACVKKHSTMIDGHPDIDAIARARDISDDEGSDAETAVYSFVTNSEAVDQAVENNM